MPTNAQQPQNGNMSLSGLNRLCGDGWLNVLKSHDGRRGWQGQILQRVSALLLIMKNDVTHL